MTRAARAGPRGVSLEHTVPISDLSASAQDALGPLQAGASAASDRELGRSEATAPRGPGFFPIGIRANTYRRA